MVREQLNANTAFLDLSGIYGSDVSAGRKLRLLHVGLMRTSNWGRNLPAVGGRKRKKQAYENTIGTNIKKKINCDVICRRKVYQEILEQP